MTKHRNRLEIKKPEVSGRRSPVIPTGEQKIMLHLLYNSRGLDQHEIIDRLDCRHDATRYYLWQLERAGSIVKVDPSWVVGEAAIYQIPCYQITDAGIERIRRWINEYGDLYIFVQAWKRIGDVRSQR